MNHPSLTSNLRFLAEQSSLGVKVSAKNNHVTSVNLSAADFEAFSYSVAHNLRSALRSINGFAKMLTDDKEMQLDAEGKDYLRIIRENALRVDGMVDDLMLLSKYYTADLNVQTVNQNKLVSKIITSTAYNGEITVGHLPPVMADAELLQQVWFNLISNAVKFSAKKEHPVIAIGAEQTEAGTVYYVKDNGAGFNMKYAGRLFTAFQRLHNEKEFVGIGLGLTIAHRVVKRHGGTIWAQAEPDNGAIFYFTIATE